MNNRRLPLIVFVGGFLGAGKTTLIMEAARRLIRRGTRVAVITNDQDQELVDTKVAEMNGLRVREVTGGCFCCKLSTLLDAAEQLLAYNPDVIFAEPVGSCIDLSSTLLQPITTFHRAHYRVAPLTVLVDPTLTSQIESGNVDQDTAYLFKNQLAEADLIALTKMDFPQDSPTRLKLPPAMRLSGKTGEGVDEWLEIILNGSRVAGSRVLDVDYDRYADAEAALGWVNVHGRVELVQAAGPASLAGPLLESIEQALTCRHIPIAHLKIFDRTPFGYVKASICRNGEEARGEGDLLADPATEHEVAINLRAVGDPETLGQIVVDAFQGIAGAVRITHSAAFRPAPPVPECRIVSRSS